MNLNGQVVLHTQVDAPQQTLEIAILPKGIYIVCGEMPSGVLVQTKLVIE